MENLKNIESKLLTHMEAAAYLGLKPSRIRYETFLKRIPTIKLGRSVRYSKEQLDQWIKQNTRDGKSA